MPTVCANIQLEKKHPITYVNMAEANNSYKILAVNPIGNVPLKTERVMGGNVNMELREVG
jgi:hypothetical protein